MFGNVWLLRKIFSSKCSNLFGINVICNVFLLFYNYNCDLFHLEYYLCVPVIFISLAKDVSILLVFSMNQLLVSYAIVCLPSVLLISAYIIILFILIGFCLLELNA